MQSAGYVRRPKLNALGQHGDSVSNSGHRTFELHRDSIFQLANVIR